MTNDSEDYDMMEKLEKLELKQTWEREARVFSRVYNISFIRWNFPNIFSQLTAPLRVCHLFNFIRWRRFLSFISVLRGHSAHGMIVWRLSTLYRRLTFLLLIFRDKVIRVTPKSSNEVDFLSSLESRQDLEVGLKEGPGELRYERSEMLVRKFELNS